MKRILCAFVLLCVIVSGAWAASFEAIAIDSTNFPDDAFRAYVSGSFDKNGDGMLSYIEKTINARIIDVANMGIKSLKGIEHFTMVTRQAFVQLQPTDIP